MNADDEREAVLWDVQRSIRYHDRRRAFFDFWHRLTAALSLIFASAAAVDLLNASGHGIAIGAAFVVAVLSALDLVVGTAEKARKHDDLRRRFIKLESGIRRDERPSPQMLAAWSEERLAIELDELPIYRALDVLCWNELAIATRKAKPVPLSTLKRLTAHWLRWENLASQLPLPPPIGGDG